VKIIGGLVIIMLFAVLIVFLFVFAPSITSNPKEQSTEIISPSSTVLVTETKEANDKPYPSNTPRPTKTFTPIPTDTPTTTITPTISFPPTFTNTPTEALDPTVGPDAITQIPSPVEWWRYKHLSGEIKDCDMNNPYPCIYEIRVNDYYSRISYNFYATNKHYDLIRNMNRNFDGTYQKLYRGTMLYIPDPFNFDIDPYGWGFCIQPNGSNNPTPCFYAAQEGETFADISFRIYGKDDYADLIIKANYLLNGKPVGDIDQNGIIDDQPYHEDVNLVIPSRQ
jgi:hypothetical protein